MNNLLKVALAGGAIYAGVKLLGGAKAVGDGVASKGSVGLVSAHSLPMASAVQKTRGLDTIVTISVPFNTQTTKGGVATLWNYQMVVTVNNTTKGISLGQKSQVWTSMANGDHSFGFTMPISSISELGDHQVVVLLLAATSLGGAPTADYTVSLASKTTNNVYEIIIDPTLISSAGSIGLVSAARLLM